MKFNDVNIEKRVLDIVSDIILKNGIKGWNMDQLSEQAGLAKNTLYRIIGSKEDLIEKVTLAHIKGVQQKLVDISNSDADYFAALEKIIHVFPELMSSIYANTFKEIFVEYPRIENSVRNYSDDVTKSIILFIQKGVNCGVLRKEVSPEYVYEIFKAIVMHYIKAGYNGQEMSSRLSKAFSYFVQGIKNN